MNTKSNMETSNQCEFCKRKFIRESTILTHLCEPKRRWNDRETQTNRFAHNAFKTYHQKNHPNKKNIEYIDFIHSPFYTAFVKFANYCLSNKVINIPRYIDFLVSHKVVVDHWNSDVHYTKFLIEYLKLEDPYDAVKRSIECLSQLCNEQNLQIRDSFKFLNHNKLCHYIVNGNLSPWFLYQSKEGTSFIAKLNQDQIKLIFDYINPDVWSVKIARQKNIAEDIRSMLESISL